MHYWCKRCKKEVEPVLGEFQHPHLGTATCYRCPDCKRMVYPKEILD